MPICMCNRCKGQHSWHRNTVAAHIRDFGRYDPTAVPVTVRSSQGVASSSSGIVGSAGAGKESPSTESSGSSSSSSSESDDEGPAAKRGRTVSPQKPDSDRNEASPDTNQPLDDIQGGSGDPDQAIGDIQDEPIAAQTNISASVGQPLTASASSNAAAPLLDALGPEEPELGQVQQAAQDVLTAAAMDQNPPPAQQPFTGDQTIPEDDEPAPSIIDHIQTSQEYISLIQQATLENGRLPQAVIDHLRTPSPPDENFSDGDVRLCLSIYVAASRSSEAVYEGVREALEHRFPPDEDGEAEVNTLSIHNVRKAVATIAGVHPITDDMCINSCLAFTGPFADEDKCPKCNEPRYIYGARGKRSSRKQMTTIPLGPQLAALRRSKEYATDLRYRHKHTKKILSKVRGVEADSSSGSSDSDSSSSELDSSGNEELVYDDIFSGSDYLDLVQGQNITENDTMVTFSFDGAQLYRNKESDTWLGIWIVNDYSPKLRYKRKHVLPAFIVPGPNKPKLLDSYTFRSFHHLSAIQREDQGRGIKVWDALKGTTIRSRVFLHLITADAVALTEMDGRVGHHGRLGCRIGCPMPGRYKPGSGGHYYAVHSLPDDYAGTARHPDIDVRELQDPSPETYQENLSTIIQSQNQTEYANNRKATGLSKPSILSGCHPDRMLPLPKCFSIDVMHLVFINAGELLIPLWRGVPKLLDKDDSFEDWPWLCLKDDRVWKAHGKLVADSKQYFPSSFHRTPRNPAEKINSGYKATEYYLYIFGLGPGIFRPLLPPVYWKNFCQLVRGVRIILQRSITDQQLAEAYKCFIQFVEDFEALYYKRKVSRMHFCRPWIHTLLHIVPETARIGPGAYYSQFTMERAIGDYGRDIRQPSNPFGNLAKVMERHAQLNAFYAIYPDMAPSKATARKGGDTELEDGYAFLHPTSGSKRAIPGPHGEYLVSELGPSTKKVYWWGRLRLPNGQIIRSMYRERTLVSEAPRIARNAKIVHQGRICYAEVQFYFRFQHAETRKWGPKALVVLYSEPIPDLLSESHGALYACHLREGDLAIVDVKDIRSLVSIHPLPPCAGDPPNLFFVVEKSGLEDADIVGSGQGDD